ncbi:TetR/AcrR family transcriptional regulator [Nocardioides massiliensis]|uniref:AcrR family transcriptional regulator n=1 Tax=Nocardioides massiliensis TaxID=1325935 RepID=A0ABT9NVP4_9ACTN|nr:TetR/AcrR family transcriptional regulator [Nocardioides massiliensis]MDP9823895.1 AcrR family transcriptional regulator [Nocardioides massiliensis]
MSGPDRADRADRRRTALLEALDELLQEHPLAQIKIADISHRAGVTRSAFYFYFDSKAIAVAALMSEVYDERFVATTLLRAEDETPQARIDAGLRAMFDVVTERAHLHRALGDARNTDATVRALWDADRSSFVGPVVELIEAERAAGNAPAGPDAAALATLLLELNDRVLERVARGSELDVRPQLDAVIAIWLRSIYGSGGTA